MSARKPALVFIFITLVLDVLGIGLIVPVLPKLIEHFKAVEMGLPAPVGGQEAPAGVVAAAAVVTGVLGSLYALMQFLFAPMLGSLSDRFGRRPVILISLFGSGVDLILLAYAPSLAWFFVGRLVSGLTGANFGAAAAYIADITPPEKRAANFGLIGAAFGLGFVLGPALGGWLAESHGLRAPFLVAGALTLANVGFGLFVLPESLRPENRRAFSWARSNPVGSLFALRRHPVVLGLAATLFLTYLAHQVLPSTWVLYTGYRYGWGTRETGLSLALVGIMAGAVQGGLTRVVVRKLGEARTALFGLVLSAVAYAAYGFATQGWMIYGIIVLGSVAGVCGPAIQAIISRDVGADEQGGVQGSLTSLTSVAGIIAQLVATRVFAHFIRPEAAVHVPGAAFFLSSVLALAGAALAWRSFKKHPEEVPPAPGAGAASAVAPPPADG